MTETRASLESQIDNLQDQVRIALEQANEWRERCVEARRERDAELYRREQAAG